MLRDRFKAATIHLTLSLLVGGIVLALFTFIWYPPPLFAGTGGKGLFLTILAVDIVMGPLLTFAIYRKHKPGLKFDLSVIAVGQALALGYGLHVALEVRPAFIAVLPMRATLVRANDIVAEPPLSGDFHVPLWGPRFVAVVDDSTPAQKQDMLLRVLAGEPDIDFRPYFYRPLEENLPKIIAEAEPLARLIRQYPYTEGYYRRWAGKRGYRTLATLRYLPLVTPDRELELIFDASRKSIVGIADFPQR